MAEGITNLPYYKNEKTGTLQMWEGTPALDNLISTDEIDCAQAAATTIATVTAGFKGYVTMLSMYNSTAAAQTFIVGCWYSNRSSRDSRFHPDHNDILREKGIIILIYDYIFLYNYVF
jgi:hypothetical protein